MRVVVLSGISGSGKTTFLRALEDAGYFCVDNFPLTLLPKVLEAYELTGGKIEKCAFVVDVREREFFEGGREILLQAKEKYEGEVVFLESPDEILVRRFKETRRAHPLFHTANISDAISQERDLVGWIKEIADKVINTSEFTTHGLRNFVTAHYGSAEKRMKINLVSFGFAYGIPLEADMVLDVRFLPNPHFVSGLREKTGLDLDVAQYVRSNETYEKFFPMLLDFVTYLIPLYEKEGKSYFTLCFGCTGGRHRSVAILNELEHHLSRMDYAVSAVHRDIDKEER
jgi:RNase adapter protein RapZ